MHTGQMRADVAERRFSLDIESLIEDGSLDWTTGGPEGEVYVYESQVREIVAERAGRGHRSVPLHLPTRSAAAPVARDRAAAARIEATNAGVAARTRSAREAASEYLATVDAMVRLSALRPSAQASEPEDRAAAIARAFAGAAPAAPAAESPARDAEHLVEQLVALSSLRPT